MVQGEVAQIGRGDLVGVEPRLGEDLEQVTYHARVVVAAEGMKIHAEDLRQLDEEHGWKRPAVGLDEIEVAGRAPEALGHLHLAEALSSSKPSDLGPQPRQLAVGLAHDIYKLNSFTGRH